MPDRMQRFTQRARKTLILAQEEADRLGHNHIGSQHLLLGLIRQEDSVAGRALRQLGLTTQQVQDMIERSASKEQLTTFLSRMDLSPNLKKVLELAVEEARRKDHHYIGTEHLLLGLVSHKKATAYDVLKQLKVTPEQVRQQVQQTLEDDPPRSEQPDTAEVQEFSPRMQRVFSLALQEAQRLQHNSVDTGHMLLALLHEEESVASRALRELGLTADQVQEVVEHINPPGESKAAD